MERPSTARLTRRRLITLGAGAAAATALHQILFAGIPPPRAEAPNIKISESSPEAIRDKELGFGGRNLELADVEPLIPRLAELYIQTSGSQRTVDEIVQNTFIIQNKIDKDPSITNPFGQPIITYLMERYPHLKLDKQEAQDLVEVTPYVKGLALSRKIFIVLDSLNNGSGKQTVKWQFDEAGRIVPCRTYTPVVGLRSAVLHELTHADGDPGWVHVEDDIKDAHKKVLMGRNNGFYDGASPEDFAVGLKMHLRAAYWRADENGIKMGKVKQGSGGLDELVTDYLGSGVSTSNKLPYMIVYGYPIDLDNLRAIFSQSDMSDVDVKKLHDKTMLREFLVQLANGAFNTKFSSETDKVSFGVKHFLSAQSSIFSTQIMLPTKILKDHYFGVTDVWHNYGEMETLPDGVRQGCVFEPSENL